MLRRLLASFAFLLPAHAELVLEDVNFRQYENGPFWERDHLFFAGDLLFFDARLKGYAVTEGLDQKLELAWTIRAVDKDGRLLAQPKKGEVKAELAPDDKDYRPRPRADFQLPLLLLSGDYAIEVVVTDAVAKAEKKFKQPFRVGGRAPELGTTLTANGLRFYRAENDRQPLADPVYRPGDTVFLKFDISGYKFGAGHRIDAGYGLLVLTPDAQPFLREENAARFETATFYPQLWIPAALEVRLPAGAQPGEYPLLLTIRDFQGKQTEAVRTSFTVTNQ